MNTLLGTLLVSSGTGTLNQVLEHRFDALMRRTSRRPVAAGRVRAANAAWFGIALSIAGVLYLLLAVNALASPLAALTFATYLLVYTPLTLWKPSSRSGAGNAFAITKRDREHAVGGVTPISLIPVSDQGR